MTDNIPGLKVKILSENTNSLPQIQPISFFINPECLVSNLVYVIRKKLLDQYKRSVNSSQSIFLSTKKNICINPFTKIKDIYIFENIEEGFLIIKYRPESTFG